MSGFALPYRLRPNKAVDRELFISLLMRLAPGLGIDKYHYVGLGGPFLEDFRLVHSRVGIGRKRGTRVVGRLTCVESELEVHKRQRFNRPVGSVKCVHSTLEKFLDQTNFTTPVIIWFDYTTPRSIKAQIERFAATVATVPIGSILRVTLNADPGSLGDPPSSEKLEWRLQRFKDRLGSLVPSGCTAGDMTFKKYGPTLLQVLKLAVEKQALSVADRRIVWTLATHYADGQGMATAALVVGPPNATVIERLVKGWEFYTTPDEPHRIELPALSSLERLTMESSSRARRKLGFDLARVDESRLGVDPFEVFKKFCRLYPHFSRVEL